MSEYNLTRNEKAALLAISDIKHPNDYDKDFYVLLCQCAPVGPEEFDDRKRRATTKFINAYFETVTGRLHATGIDSDSIVKAGLHFMLTLGYELGRKLRTPLTRK